MYNRHFDLKMKNSRQKKKDYHFVKRRVWIRYLNGYFNLDDHSDFIDKDEFNQNFNNLFS